jgi:hypothetical protein
MSVNPEERNIPWNRDGHGGGDDPNNSENILIAWLQSPGNYKKFRSPPSGMTKIAVCEEISRKIDRAGTLKVRKAPSVVLKIKAMEGAFRDAHDWATNTGVGVLASDGRVTFEEAVTKRFTFYFDLLEVMNERASARPLQSTDGMDMTRDEDDDDSDDELYDLYDKSSPPSSPRPPSGGDDDEDKNDEGAAPEKGEEEEYEGDGSCYPSPTFESPPSPHSTDVPTPTIATVLVGASPSGSYSSVTEGTPVLAPAEVSKVCTEKKIRKETPKKKTTTTKAKKNKARTKKGTSSSINEIDMDDDSWQVSMLDIKCGEVDLEQEKWSSQKELEQAKWSSQKEQQAMELQLQREKWKSASKQQNLEYQFDLMVKYKELQKKGFDNNQIVAMIPDMLPIMDKSNMPVHKQMSEPSQPSQSHFSQTQVNLQQSQADNT